LGSEQVWVVHGAEGLDEISLSGYTKVTEYRQGMVRTFYTHPGDFGVEPASLDALRVSGRDESVEVARSVLAGECGAARNFVVVNAAAGLVVEGRAPSLAEGATMASAALDEGRVAEKLEALVAASTRETE
jgi:anthranilate phosphoribosyltransferase